MLASDVILRPVPEGALRDVWLHVPGVLDTSEARDDKPGRGRHYLKPRKPEPIVAHALFHALLRRYGPVNGQRIYRRMQAEGKGPFAPGAKYSTKGDPDA